MMVIRAFNKQALETKRFDQANRDLTDTGLFVARVMVTMMPPVMMLLMSGISLLIVWVGAHQVAQATMQVGDMMAFMQYAMQIVFSFLTLSIMFIFLPRAAPFRATASPTCWRHKPPSTTHKPHRPSPNPSPDASSSAMSAFAIPARRTYCAASPSPPNRAKPRPSSAPREAANPP